MEPVARTIVWSWLEPECSSDAQLAVLAEDEWRAVERAVAWIRERAGDEWGVTIPSGRIVPAGRVAAEPDELDDVLESVAAAARYGTGEGLYSEDCPEFTDSGIARS